MKEHLLETGKRERADFDKDAWLKALQLYPVLREYGKPVHNAYNIAQIVLMRRIIQREPIPFVGFWGIGGKMAADSLDMYLIDHLDELRQRMQEQYEQGTSIALILADMHGVFNRYGSVENMQLFPDSQSYINQIQEVLTLRGMRSIWLKDLYAEHGIQIPNINEPIDIRSEAFDVFSRQRQQYINAAGKYNNSDVEPSQVAYHYVRMRLDERKMLTSTFPDTILLINSSKMIGQPLLPAEMPILYLQIGAVWFHKGTPLEIK